MRARSYSRGVLLALVLLFGQWLNFAHASDHPAVSSAHQSCEFCVHAQGLLPGLADLPQQVTLSFVHETPDQVSAYFFGSTAPSFYAIRGPPRFIA